MAGISAVFSDEDSTLKASYALFQVHHRGQGSSGISVGGDKSIKTYSGNGRMEAVFPEKVMNSLVHPNDYTTIGHVGKEKKNENNVPPIEIESDGYKISLAMDGIILNPSEMDDKFNLKTSTSEELFGKLFLDNLESTKNPWEASYNTMEQLDKAYYSLVMLLRDKKENETKLIGLRDMRGVKPMYFGKNENDFIIASESGAIDVLERLEGNKMSVRGDVNPGEMFLASKEAFDKEQILKPRPAHCIFEWVYTARPDSVMNGINSHSVRKKLGHSLVKLHGIKNDGNTVGTAVPASGNSVGIGICEASDISFDVGIIKNQYVGRTYIIANPEKRSRYAFLKHNPIKDVVEGKRVIIGDDSIVRGTISEAISAILKEAGAESVDFAVSYAPIIEACFEDEPDKKLAARKFRYLDFREIGKKVAEELPSIDNVIYNNVDSVIEAVGIPKDQFCTWCISGINPFE